MRCKPGDLAVVTRGENVGIFVDVIEPHDCLTGAWYVRVHSDAVGSVCPVKKGELVGCYDSKLRPIRDPGNDAVDETLLWKPVPGEVVTC